MCNLRRRVLPSNDRQKSVRNTLRVLVRQNLEYPKPLQPLHPEADLLPPKQPKFDESHLPELGDRWDSKLAGLEGH